MHNGPYWIGYDDEASLAIKAEFANHLGLAGAFVWSIDTDDFNGENSDEPFPLMKTINRALVKMDLVVNMSMDYQKLMWISKRLPRFENAYNFRQLLRKRQIGSSLHLPAAKIQTDRNFLLHSVLVHCRTLK